jgi:hypothetical protein
MQISPSILMLITSFSEFACVHESPTIIAQSSGQAGVQKVDAKRFDEASKDTFLSNV